MWSLLSLLLLGVASSQVSVLGVPSSQVSVLGEDSSHMQDSLDDVDGLEKWQMTMKKSFSPPPCSENEEFSETRGACQPSCDLPIVCMAMGPGCACKTGFIRSTAGGACMPTNECPARDSHTVNRRDVSWKSTGKILHKVAAGSRKMESGFRKLSSTPVSRKLATDAFHTATGHHAATHHGKHAIKKLAKIANHRVKAHHAATHHGKHAIKKLAKIANHRVKAHHAATHHGKHAIKKLAKIANHRVKAHHAATSHGTRQRAKKVVSKAIKAAVGGHGSVSSAVKKARKCKKTAARKIVAKALSHAAKKTHKGKRSVDNAANAYEQEFAGVARRMEVRRLQGTTYSMPYH